MTYSQDQQADFLTDIGAGDHYQEVTSEIFTSDDGDSLLTEDNKHAFVAQALGARRQMREGTMDGDDAFDHLSNKLGDNLENMGVPKPNYGLDTQFGEGEGETSHNDGGASDIQLSPDDFSGAELGREAVDTLYHESLHAEQWKRATDVLDGSNDDPSSRDARLADEFDPGNADMRSSIQKEGGDAYRTLPTEQEAWQSGGDVGEMYENVGAVHDELEAKMAGVRKQLDDEAEERSAQF
jgi:hypothetical protein